MMRKWPLAVTRHKALIMRASLRFITLYKAYVPPTCRISYPEWLSYNNSIMQFCKKPLYKLITVFLNISSLCGCLTVEKFLGGLRSGGVTRMRGQSMRSTCLWRKCHYWCQGTYLWGVPTQGTFWLTVNELFLPTIPYQLPYSHHTIPIEELHGKTA